MTKFFKKTFLTRALLLVAATVLFFACSGKTTRPFSSSDAVPAAQGQVKVGEADNGNTALDVEVKHLAPPQRLAGNASTYVVWIRPAAVPGVGDQREPSSQPVLPQNIGALAVDSDLTGSLKTVTPYRSFELFVTAEPLASVSAPSGDQLLWTHVDR